MSTLNWFRFFLLASFVTSSVFSVDTQSLDSFLPQKTIADIDIDVGVPLKKENPNLLMRLRVGKQWIQGDIVKSVGVVGGRYAVMGFGGGVESELLQISSGFWAQGKILTAERDRLVTGISLGWSLFGIEGLLTPTKISHSLLIAKIRLPIGLLTQ